MAASGLFVAPPRGSWPHMGAPPKVPTAGFAWRPRASSAHPREDRGPSGAPQHKWQGSHGGLGPVRRTPHGDRGPRGSTTEAGQENCTTVKYSGGGLKLLPELRCKICILGLGALGALGHN
eukprot:9359433-Pyramimonas_sp.AAC.1